ncbi:MAG: hypothetical protein V2A74_00405 [bacterium]
MPEFDIRYLVDETGRRRNVVLPIEEFEELLECAQDVLDSVEIERLRGEPRFAWSRVKAHARARRAP